MKIERTVEKITRDLFPFVVEELKDRWVVTEKRTRKAYTVMKDKRRRVGECDCGRKPSWAVLCEHQYEVRKALLRNRLWGRPRRR